MDAYGAAVSAAARAQERQASSSAPSFQTISAPTQKAASRPVKAVSSSDTAAIAPPQAHTEKPPSAPSGTRETWSAQLRTSVSGSEARNELFIEKRCPHSIGASNRRCDARYGFGSIEFSSGSPSARSPASSCSARLEDPLCSTDTDATGPRASPPTDMPNDAHSSSGPSSTSSR